MKKIFLTAVFALMILPSICGATEIKSANYKGDFQFSYPEVKTSSAIANAKINQRIREEIKNFIASAREPNPSVTATTDYKIPYDDDKVLSILLTEYVNYEHSAHPSVFLKALNFDVKSGKPINTVDLKKYDKKISPKDLTRKLKAHAAREGIVLYPEFKAVDKLPNDFYFDENFHLHFIFQQYEVAPYAAGIIDVDVDEEK